MKSTYVGELVMEALKNLDHVAYVRFASVYRSLRCDISTTSSAVGRRAPRGDSSQLELAKRGAGHEVF